MRVGLPIPGLVPVVLQFGLSHRADEAVGGVQPFLGGFGAAGHGEGRVAYRHRGKGALLVARVRWEL
jgi:hypothetical protein